MNENNRLLAKLVGGSVLIGCGIGVILRHSADKELLETKELRNSIIQKFQTASAEERLESLRKGLVSFECQDKATGSPYTFGNLEKDDVTDEGLKVSGCTITSSVNGKSFVVAPAP